MTPKAFLKLKGKTMGTIKGGVTQKGREGWIEVLATTHEITSPRDVATGQATGKRIHKPFVITKELDRSTPLLMECLVKNESLLEFELRYFTAIATGVEKNHFTIKLTNAFISNIKQIKPDNRIPDFT